MKKILLLIAVIGFLFLSGIVVGEISSDNTISNTYDITYEKDYGSSFEDISAYRYQTVLYSISEGADGNPYCETLQGTGIEGDYPIGEIIWQYQITGGCCNSTKAIAPIPDINDDGIDDVIVCSEDYYVRCFDGGAIGTGVILWEHFIYSGKLWCQNELTITEDVDDDGYNDVVVGTPWGDRSIHTLSGKNGNEIWKYDTHQDGDGGWVYQVDCSYDYNGDDVIDVLAIAGGTASGSRKAYCLDGEDGAKIWDLPLGSPKGPGFSIIGIEDFTGDGQPDVLAGASNSAETIGYAYGINGATGSITWTFTAGGSSVWALGQIDDITGDGIKDVIIGDSFTGNIYGLDATTGGVEYSNSLGSASITRFAKLNDVNGDGHPDFVPAHSTLHVTQVIDGQTGSFIWTHPVADQPWNVARTADISGDGIDDVLVGTLYNNYYCYFLNGTDGSELCSKNYYEPVDAIMAIPDVVNDGSMEMVVGGRDGKVACFSGGLVTNPPEAPDIDGPVIGIVGIEYEYYFSTTDPDEDDVYYYIEWGDGQVDEWVGPYKSGELAKVSHTWTSPDDYEIRAKAKDTNDAESEWSDVYPVTIVENEPPNAPTIEGKTSGKAGTSYLYTFTSTDPNEDQVSYYIKWDDGSITDWTAFQASGPPGYDESHTWDEQGTYTIEAKAVDVFGAESEWGELTVTMPRNRAMTNLLLLRFLEQFPILQKILLLLQR